MALRLDGPCCAAAVGVDARHTDRGHGADGAPTLHIRIHASYKRTSQCNDVARRRRIPKRRSRPTARAPVAPQHTASSQVWTSLKSLDGREFCFMLNSLIRDDAKLTDEVADQVPPRDGPW